MLTTALRENRGYLQDQGWHQTARLMNCAAEEIERLSERVRDLENRTVHDRTVHDRTRAASARPTIPSPPQPDSV
jgi:hypothetical protein